MLKILKCWIFGHEWELAARIDRRRHYITRHCLKCGATD